MSRPLRSAPITGASALLRASPPARAASVLSASRFRRPARSLSRPASSRASISACLPTFRTQAADRARATCTPGTTWPAIRALRQAHPGTVSIPPVLMPSNTVSTLQRWFTRVRLPGPCLTALTPPFPHRSPQRSSANAACGGLAPPPAGRHRGAMNPHLACSMHIQSSPPTRRLLSALVAQGNSG